MESVPPIVDPQFADELFTAVSADDAKQLRAMVADFHADIAPRFSVLRDSLASGAANAVGQRELHQLRGVVANFALAAAASRLRDLESGWSTWSTPAKSDGLRAAEADVQAGIAALQERFPYLR